MSAFSADISGITLESDYADLALQRTWGPVTIDFHLGLLPPDELISNVNLVPFCGDKVVALRLVDGRYEMPGGTREPNEPWLDTLRRELTEEAGAELRWFTHFGAWSWTTSAAEPYRAHLPHPTAYRVVGFGDVSLVGEPTNPEDGEQVAGVEVLSLDVAVTRFQECNRADRAQRDRLTNRIRHARDGV